MSDPFLHPLSHAEIRADKPFKTTFFSSERLLIGLNTLARGQQQELHEHAGEDKFYFVLAGAGEFTVGERVRRCGPGDLILAPAGVAHGVANTGDAPFSFLTAIAPPP